MVGKLMTNTDLSNALLEAIMAWDKDWRVNLRDNEPYYDLLWRIQEVIERQCISRK